MSDDRFHRLFQVIDGSPDPAFVAGLRARLLDTVDGLDAIGGAATPGPDGLAGAGAGVDATITPDDDQPRSSRSWRWIAAAAAVLVVIVGGVLVLVDRDPKSITTDDSTVPPPTTVTVATTVAPATTIAATTTIATTTPTTVPDTTQAPPRSGPRTTLPVDMPAGEYRLEQSVVPLSFTTTGSWSRVLDFEDRLAIGRGAESVDGELVITFDQFRDALPDTVLPTLCPELVELGELTPATLLGEDGFRVEGSTVQGCTASRFGGNNYFLPANTSFVITVAEVDGHVVSVIGDGPTTDWATGRAEITALIDSMQRL